MMANQDEREGGVQIDRDDNGRSDIQPTQQGAVGSGRQVSENSEADAAPTGGSSGSGGYGNAENQQHHQGVGQASYGNGGELGQSRGEKYDEAQGGGRRPAAADDPDQGSGA